MSKVILWAGLIMSIIILLFTAFVANHARPLVVLFWISILINSTYKLFFAQPKQEFNS